MDILNNQTITEISKIDGWLTNEEGIALFHLANMSKGNTIVEIGSYKGKSTVFIALGVKKSLRDVKIYAIDPHKGKTHIDSKNIMPTFSEFKKNIKKFKVAKFIKPILKTSNSASIGWKKSISLLFIDGLHEYECVKNDIYTWTPYLEENGIVAFHDAFSPYPDVFKAVKEEIFDSNKFKSIGYSGSIIYAIKGNSESIKKRIQLYYIKKIIILCWSIWQIKFIPDWIQFKIVNRIKMLIPQYSII